MTDGLQHTAAAEIRAEMARQRKTQQDVARALGISAQQLGQRLAGRISFDVRELGIIADYLGVAPTQFLAGANSRSAA